MSIGSLVIYSPDGATNDRLIAGLRGRATVDLPVYCFIYECRAYEIVKWELNQLILCDMSAFEQEYSQVCL